MSTAARNIILIGVVFIVIAGLTLWLGRSKTSTSTTQASNMQTVTTVTYNGKAFVPAEITISKGTTITFVNSSATTMQVSSANAGFNAAKPLAKGESYSFTFNTVGNFTYLNQLNTTEAGKVTVLQ